MLETPVSRGPITICFALTIALSMLGDPAMAGAPPSFEQYSVPIAFAGVPAPVDLSSDPDAKRFRTRLRERAEGPPDFADHFAVARWRCGTDCQVVAIIDATTGAVHFLPIVAEVDVSYVRDSRLMVVNPPDAIADRGWKIPDDCATWVPSTSYYEWTGTEFRLLRRVDPCKAK
jgi:hypothetical protein